MTLRPLLQGDVDGAAEVAMAAIAMPAPFEDDDRPSWVRRRIAHHLAKHPGGAWIAEQDGAIAGVALALAHDGVWGLSLLAVQPALHARGLGRALMAAALRYGLPDARGAIVCSSTDPKAMRLYARSGFGLRPSVALAGIVDRAALPAGLVSAESEDLEAAAALGRPVRGAAYDPADLGLYLDAGGGRLLLWPGRGFAVHRDGSPRVLCATDDAAAQDLLRSCLAASTRGGTVQVDFLTADQDWAVQAGLEAGLVLSPDGPVFTRGDLGPLRPWIPSGAFL